MERITLQLEGMSCGHCVKAVQQAVASVEGAEAEQVAIGTATITFDPARTSVGALIDVLSDAGYEARDAT